MSVRTIQLGEVCEFVYGDSLKEERRHPGKVPVFGSNGIVGWHDQAITSGPTIVIGRKGSIGEINWSNEPCFPIDTTYFVEETKQPCDLRWLYFMLLKLDLTRLNKSAAIPGLNREDAYEQRVPWPDLSEQKRIARLLDQADRLRHIRRHASQISDTFVQSLFLEMFGHPDLALQRFEVRELQDVVRFIDYRGIAPNKVASGIPLVTARNVKRGYFEFEPREFIPAEEYEEWMTRGKPEPGDVLFTTEGHTLGSAAKLPAFPRVALAQRLITMSGGNDLTSDYLLQFILTRCFQDAVATRSTGSAARGISSKKLGEIRIPVPPLPLQQRFAGIVARHDRLRAQQHEAERQVDHLFQSLLSHAFSFSLAV